MRIQKNDCNPQFLSSIIGNHSIKQVKYPSMAMITTDTLKLNDEHKNLHESILDILECHKGDDYWNNNNNDNNNNNSNNNNNNNNNKNCDSSTRPHSLEVTQSMINRCYSPPPKIWWHLAVACHRTVPDERRWTVVGRCLRGALNSIRGNDYHEQPPPLSLLRLGLTCASETGDAKLATDLIEWFSRAATAINDETNRFSPIPMDVDDEIGSKANGSSGRLMMVPLEAYRRALRICSDAGETKLAARLLDLCLDEGIVDGAVAADMCTVLIAGHVQKGDADGAKEVIRNFENRGLAPKYVPVANHTLVSLS